MTLVFAFFVFFYIYFFQSDLLALTVEVLTREHLRYDSLVGALLLTSLLLGLQILVEKKANYRRKFRVFSFLPSSILLVVLTSIVPSVRIGTFVLCGIAGGVWLLSLFVCRKEKTPGWLLRYEDERLPLGRWKHLTRRALAYVALFLFIGVVGNGDELQHNELKVARLINERQYEAALTVGRHSVQTTPLLTSLRAIAMAYTSKGLGNLFFSFPLPKGGSEAMLAAMDKQCVTLWDATSFYEKLGEAPPEATGATAYFKRLAEKQVTHFAKDFYLCALLMDKKLPLFAVEIRKYYDLSSPQPLPKYYRQALILYARRSGTISLYKDESEEANLRDFKEVEEQHNSDGKRAFILRELYGNTYWFYYYYQSLL